MNRYIGLHNHSEYSNVKLVDSINRFNLMVDYAWDLGMGGLAMTEHDCLSGTFYALQVYRDKLEKEWKIKHTEEGAEFPGYEKAAKELDFKVIIGNEIYLSENNLTEMEMDGKHPAHFWHLILLAKDKEGYMQLKRLSSAAWRRAWFRGILRTPTYSSDLIREVKNGHLICSTACLGGFAAWCWKMAFNKPVNAYDEAHRESPQFYISKLDNHLAAMEKLFGKGNFYIELQPNEDGSDQNGYNEFMIKRYWGIYPFIFTTDAHYLKAEDREIHKAFLHSKDSQDREVDTFYKYAYIMSEDEIRSRMNSYTTQEQFNEMAQNTRRIGDMCQYYELEEKPQLAVIEYEHWDEYADDLSIFDDVDEETYPNFYYYIHTNNRHDNYLARLVAHGFIEKREDDWNDDIYYKRLEEEFWTLKTVGEKIEQPMSDYFITMSKIIDICWNNAGSIVGPSRGSAGAMLINYLLGITQMDPVKMELPYVWRFLHPSRPDLPD